MNTYTVEQVNTYINRLIETDENLKNFYIVGEISNYRPSSSGHLYFSLKDASGTIDCVMFRSYASKINFRMENGQFVVAHGSVSTYVKTGRYQIYLTSMMLQGQGDLHARFEQLKEKLHNEGLFDEQYKKQIPFLPRLVGVVTSQTGSVIQDIINVATRRFKGANIKIYPSLVQGEQAPKSLIRGINILEKQENVDVIIIARGGGSFEDLFCFNDENLARTIFDCKVPVVSAVGHETDFTICDFVSDLRAPTPSAAAEIVFPMYNDLVARIDEYVAVLNKKLINVFDSKKMQLEWYKKSLSPNKMINKAVDGSRICENLKYKLISIVTNKLEVEKIKKNNLVSHLDAISPLKVLSRGYSIVTDEEKNVIKKINQVNVNDKLSVRILDGTIDCTVEKITKE